MGKHALLIGASGLIGTELSKQLLEDPDYSTLTLVVRRKLPMDHLKLNQVILEDFDQLGEQQAVFQEVDTVFCTLGTTIKKAKTKEKFRKVDLDYPYTAAKLALKAGVRQFAIVSSMGADESSLFFYSRTKGEIERLLQELRLPELYIFRPSLLLGQRMEHRAGEGAASRISTALPFLWSGPLKRYKPVEASAVAAAMRATVRGAHPGVSTYENPDLHLLSKEL